MSNFYLPGLDVSPLLDLPAQDLDPGPLLFAEEKTQSREQQQTPQPPAVPVPRDLYRDLTWIDNIFAMREEGRIFDPNPYPVAAWSRARITIPGRAPYSTLSARGRARSRSEVPAVEAPRPPSHAVTGGRRRRSPVPQGEELSAASRRAIQEEKQLRRQPSATVPPPPPPLSATETRRRRRRTSEEEKRRGSSSNWVIPQEEEEKEEERKSTRSRLHHTEQRGQEEMRPRTPLYEAKQELGVARQNVRQGTYAGSSSSIIQPISTPYFNHGELVLASPPRSSAVDVDLSSQQLPIHDEFIAALNSVLQRSFANPQNQRLESGQSDVQQPLLSPSEAQSQQFWKS